MTAGRARVSACAIVALLLSIAGAEEPSPEPAPVAAAAREPRASRLQGRAYLGRHDPVVGATVIALSEAAPGRVHITTTDEKGVFRLDGLPDGQYAVRVELDGLEAVEKDEIAVRYPFRAVVELPMTASSDAAEPVVRRESREREAGSAGVSVEGTVHDGRDPAGEVRLRLVRTTGETDPRTVVTGPDGKFRFAAVSAGAWSIHVQGVGKLPVRTRLDLTEDTTLDIALVRQPASHQPPPLELMPPEEPIPPPAFR